MPETRLDVIAKIVAQPSHFRCQRDWQQLCKELLDLVIHHRGTLREAVLMDADCDLDMEVIRKREPWAFK